MITLFKLMGGNFFSEITAEIDEAGTNKNQYEMQNRSLADE